ncbi:MAG: UBP-type zinc finger domain-containing protein [Rhodanobacteraceae bacterium]
MICGHIGCCDSSKNRHARAHYEATGHAIIKTIEAGPDWAWCYPDDTYLK